MNFVMSNDGTRIFMKRKDWSGCHSCSCRSF